MNIGEVDKISEGIAILILSTIGFSIEKLSEAENWLSSMPSNISRAMFVYLTGLIICEKKATNEKIASKVGYISHDTLTRMLKNGRKALGKLSILFINWCLSQTMGHLIIDDVLVPKRYARQIEGVYNEFDHADNERLKGMRIVMILWCNGNVRIPVAWAIWHKERKYYLGRTPKGVAKYRHTGECLLRINGQVLPYKTKNQIAMELFEHVVSRGLKAQYITFDSWYASRENLQMLTENRFALPLECYSRLRSNRLVVYLGQTMSVAQVNQLFEITAFNHKHGAYIKAIEVVLPDYGEIKLLLVRKDTHAEPGNTKYMFSTDVFVSAPQLLLRYRTRWAIETTFRDLKQNLNLASCQATSLDAQESHLALAIFGFVLLELLPALEFQGKTYQSIGEKKMLLSQLSLFTDSQNNYWLIDSSRHGASFIHLKNCTLGIVKLCFDFAYRSLLFSNCQRAA